jgi:hypothetical protein
VRAYFEERFSAPRMARDYLTIFEELIASARLRRGGGRTAFGLAAIDAEGDTDGGHGVDGLGGETGVGMD